MNALNEYTGNLQLLENYFIDHSSSAFYFGVINDELLQKKINQQIQHLLVDKNKNINVFSWKNNWQNQHPAQALQDFVSQSPNTHGLLITDIETALSKKPDLLTQLNFARERLSTLNIPIFFWLKKESLALIAQQAMDIYDQRIGSLLFYERPSEIDDKNLSSEKYLLQESLQQNRDLQQYKSRITALQEQLDEAEKQNLPKEQIANEIVIELLKLYVEIPRTIYLINDLLDKYLAFIDRDKAKNLYTLGETHKYLGLSNKAEQYFLKALPKYKQNKKPLNIANTLIYLGLLHSDKNELDKAEAEYNKALKIYRDLASINSVIMLSNVAGTLNNLGLLHSDKNELDKAEVEYNEALKIYKDLARSNPVAFLPDVSMTLNNLANLYSDKNELDKTETAYNEALKIRRDLARVNPVAFLPDVAGALNNLANLQLAKNKLDKAEDAYNEALKIRRELASVNPSAFLPDVSMTLNNLAVLYKDKNELEKAENAYNEALQIRRELAKINPSAFELDVAVTCINLSLFYLQSKKDKELSIQYAKECIVLCEEYLGQIYLAGHCTNLAKQVLKNWETI